MVAKRTIRVFEAQLPFRIPDDCPFCWGPLMVRDKGLWCNSCGMWILEFSEGWPEPVLTPR